MKGRCRMVNGSFIFELRNHFRSIIGRCADKPITLEAMPTLTAASAIGCTTSGILSSRHVGGVSNWAGAAEVLAGRRSWTCGNHESLCFGRDVASPWASRGVVYVAVKLVSMERLKRNWEMLRLETEPNGCCWENLNLIDWSECFSSGTKSPSAGL